MAFDSAASLLFKIGANADDAEENIARFRTLFGTSMAEMKQQFSSFAAELTGGEEAINTHWTAMAGIVAGAATAVGASLLEMVNKSAELGEQLKQLSEEIGVSVSDLSGLRVVAKEMGIDFDMLARGVAILDRNLSPFASSGATAGKAMKALGLSATDAQGKLKPNSVLLSEISEKLSHMKDGADKTAVAMSLFGRSGMEMIPVLNRGAAALSHMTDAAKGLGQYFDDQSSEQAEHYLESIRALKLQIDGLTVSIGQRLIPTMNSLLQHLEAPKASIKEFGLALKMQFEGLVTGDYGAAVIRNADAWNKLGKEISQNAEKTEQIGKQIEKTTDATKKDTAANQAASDAQKKLLEARQNTAVLFDKIAEDVKAADKKTADDSVATADSIRMSWSGLYGSVNQSAQGMIDSILGVPAKIEPAFKDLQAQIDTTVKSLNQMATESTQSTLSAGARIRSDYQQRIQAIQQFVQQERMLLNQHRITEAQMTQVTQAAAAAQNAARQQDMAQMTQLRQAQAQQMTSTVDTFLQMGLAAAGYRGVVVRALMDVIKTLEQEAIAHLVSAAGAADAENIKNAAVGKGIGLRSVWHAAEQFALGLADLATFNFAGAAKHFAASAAFGSVATSVGTAVASIFSGGGGSAAAGRAGAAGSSGQSSRVGATPAGAAATGGNSAPMVNVHIDGVISADNLTTVVQQISAAVSSGSATLTASHIHVNGATVPAGALA